MKDSVEAQGPGGLWFALATLLEDCTSPPPRVSSFSSLASGAMQGQGNMTGTQALTYCPLQGAEDP